MTDTQNPDFHAFAKGWRAGITGQPASQNPYRPMSRNYRQWADGRALASGEGSPQQDLDDLLRTVKNLILHWDNGLPVKPDSHLVLEIRKAFAKVVSKPDRI